MLALSLLLALQQPVTRWSTEHTLEAVGTTALIAVDCATTIRAVERGQVERNPFLGAHPSRQHLLSMCALGATANLVVSWALPAKVRRWWFATVGTGVTLAIVLRPS